MSNYHGEERRHIKPKGWAPTLISALVSLAVGAGSSWVTMQVGLTRMEEREIANRAADIDFRVRHLQEFDRLREYVYQISKDRK